MGQQAFLTDEFTDHNMDKIYPDGGMSKGTLFLLDPSHSMGAIAGLAAGSAVSNVARNTAGGIMGVAASDTDTVVAALIAGSSEIKIERTTKGGIHILPSQVNQTGSNRWIAAFPTALRDYLFNNSELTGFYFSVILRQTRAGLSQTSPATPQGLVGSPASGTYLEHMSNLAGGPPTGSQLIGRYATPNINTVNVNGLVATGVNGWTGTKPANSSLLTGSSAIAGGGVAAGFGSTNKNAGWVIYRAKIEDLSLTMRANNGAGGTLAEEYAAALAVDQAFLAQAFAVGGKFYGDTIPTDPASFP